MTLLAGGARPSPRYPVSEHQDPLDAPIAGYDDLLIPFHEAQKPASEWRIGAEMEKFGVFAEDGRPIPYEGGRGVLAIMGDLERRYGWIPEREKEGGALIALRRADASITLEPGGQLELSGAPLADIHLVAAELAEHMRELAPISTEQRIAWLGLGFHPFARRDDFTWVPKGRYGVMREYLPTRGGHALDMMLRTSTVQANYDYDSEEDALRKLRVTLKLSPLTTAMFANSPWKERARHGGVTYRGRVWLDVDPDRTGLLPFTWKDGAGYRAYIEWALDVPMFIVKREGKVFPNTAQTFRAFWKDGAHGQRATQGDWQTHLNTLFPEVRLKKTLEVRGADSQNLPVASALPALFTGVLYDRRALDEADAMTAGWKPEAVQASREGAWREGVRTVFEGKSFAHWGERLIDIAAGGLSRRARKNAAGADESIYLAPLRDLLARGQSPADVLLASPDDSPEKLIARARIPVA
jgi:glutamate--cysteine ligase